MAGASLEATSLRGRLLATISEDRAFEGFAVRVATLLDIEPADVRVLLRRAGQSADPAWVRVEPACHELRIEAGARRAGAHCSLLRIAAASGGTTHSAHQSGWVFVLQGFGVDEAGRRWAPGDLLRVPPHGLAAADASALVSVRVIEVAG